MTRSDWEPDYDGLDAERPPKGAAEGVRLAGERDCTADVVAFLERVHGSIRRDDLGDYYYDKVPAISLHLLLSSALPPKEVLWSWYDHFDRECAESIYQTVPPQRDEVLLRILAQCPFRWDEDAVRSSGLVFLSRHRTQVFTAIEDFLTVRLEAHRHMDEDALRRFLAPRNTWSDAHLAREVRRLRSRIFNAEERRRVYEGLESDYLRATARHLMDEASTEAFWKQPPPELEALSARFKALHSMLAQEAMRLGVYITREAYEGTHWREEAAGKGGARRGRRRNDTGRTPGPGKQRTVVEQFAVLHLTPAATMSEVKLAYRELVKAHHPDQGGTVEAFLHLQEAYEYLTTQVFPRGGAP